MNRDDRRVLVWREDLLPPSETFIRNQAGALARWSPALMGLRRHRSVLTAPADTVVFGDSRLDRLQRRAFWATRWHAAVDAAVAHPQVALVHAHFGPDATTVLPAARRAGTPLVVTFHGYDATRLVRDPGAKHAVYRRRLPALLQQADRLIAVSDFIADRLHELGAPHGKVVTLPIGIPLTPSRREDGDRHGVLFVGRLVEKKGVGDLLDALSRLPEPQRRAPVRIVGSGPLRPALESSAQELGLDVRFLGTLTPDEVRAEMHRAAVFCGPSQTAGNGDAEGLGMVFLEAAAARLPVVAYRHGGVVEAVQDGVTGLLAPERDIAALSGRLGRVLADPAYARALGTAGEARVRRQFDIRRCTEDLEDLYDDVVARRGARPAAVRG